MAHPSSREFAEFPLIPLPIKEAIRECEQASLGRLIRFPLIPLPIKEAIVTRMKSSTVQPSVSINSTSDKRSDILNTPEIKNEFLEACFH